MTHRNLEVVEEQVAVAERRHSVVQANELGRLIDALTRRGYEVHGPKVRDGAIVYDHIESAKDLPVGWTDEQEPGRYRLKRRSDEAFFGYVVGPQSLKKYLHPADVRLLAAERQNGTFRILNNETAPKRPYAFLGARACELAAVGVQDRVLLEDKTSIQSTKNGGRVCLSSRCNAHNRRRRAFAFRWELGR